MESSSSGEYGENSGAGGKTGEIAEVRGAGDVGRGECKGGGVMERGVPLPDDEAGESSGDEGRGESDLS